MIQNFFDTTKSKKTCLVQNSNKQNFDRKFHFVQDQLKHFDDKSNPELRSRVKAEANEPVSVYRRNHRSTCSLRVAGSKDACDSSGHDFPPANLQNVCPGGINCRNLAVITKLKGEIIRLQRAVDELRSVNEHYTFVIRQKDHLYRNILKENTLFKNTRYDLRAKYPKVKVKEKEQSSKHQSTANSYTSNKKFINQNECELIANRIKNLREEQRLSPKGKGDRHAATLRERKFYEGTNSEYERILGFMDKTNFRKIQNSSNLSFLSLSAVNIEDMLGNREMRSLFELFESEERFVRKVRSADRLFLGTLCDNLDNIAKNYKQFLRLLLRIKLFMSSTLNLVASVLGNDATKALIRNTCTILDCERCSLFIYDPFTDYLEVHTAEGLDHTFKVPKHKGIVGAVYVSGEKLKVDDAYQDPRFNKEVDRKTGYRTRNLLCFPLKDRRGATFGVIQAINKKSKHFNGDDEELLKFFSEQAASILLSLVNKETSAVMIQRLQKLVRFSQDVITERDVKLVSRRVEELMLSLFCSNSCQVLFLNKDGLLANVLTGTVHDRRDIGIVYYVMRTKQIHGCKSVKCSECYNPLIDVPANDNLVTFPVVYGKECIIVIQTIINNELSELTGKPKQEEETVFNLIRDVLITWYANNKDFISI